VISAISALIVCLRDLRVFVAASRSESQRISSENVVKFKGTAEGPRSFQRWIELIDERPVAGATFLVTQKPRDAT